MAFDYSKILAVAERLIADFGRDVTLRRRGTVPIDPENTGEPTEYITPDLTVRAAVVEFSSSLVANGSVERGDKRVLIAGNQTPGERIETDWEMIDGSVNYRVIRSMEVAPGDTRVIYDLQVRA